MRLRSIDFLRAVALLSLVFMHSFIYNLDGFFDPGYTGSYVPILFMGLSLLIGGLFVMMSGIVNTVSAISRLGLAPQFEKRVKGISRSLAAGGFLLLLLHFLYQAVFGPFSFNLETNEMTMAVLPSVIRSGTMDGFDPRRLFEQSVLSIVGWNLIIMALLWRALFSRRIVLERKLQYPVLLILTGIMFASAFMNPTSYEAVNEVYEAGDYPLALFLGFFLGKPYSIYPYTGFALFGMLIGFLLFEKHARRYMAVMFVAGLALTAGGTAEFMMNTPGLATVMNSWKSRILLEAGIYLTLISFGLLVIDTRKDAFKRPAGDGNRLSRVFRSFGMMGLTIFLLETPVSELARKLWTRFDPGWPSSIEHTAAFAGGNVALWFILLSFWKTFEYRGSFDHAWNGLMHLIRRKTSRFRPEIFDKTGKLPL